MITHEDDTTPDQGTGIAVAPGRAGAPMAIKPSAPHPEGEAPTVVHEGVPTTTASRGYERDIDPPLGGARSTELWWLVAVLVLLAGIGMIMWVLRSARSMTQTSLTEGEGRSRRRSASAGVSAWEESGRRAELPRDADTPREPGMFDDNDDEDNPDRPMWDDQPRGER